MAANLAIVVGTVSGSPVVLTSPDAVNWTAVPSWPGAGAEAAAVAGDAYFVSTQAPPNNNYALSYDGLTWTLNSLPIALTRVAWTGGRFVAVSNNQSYWANDAAGPWNVGGNPFTRSSQMRLLYEAGVLVGVGGNQAGPSNAIFWSTDEGDNWSGTTPANDWLGVHDLVWTGSMFVAVRGVATGTGHVIRSATGTSGWTVVDTGISGVAPYAAAFDPITGTIVALCWASSGARVIRSTDNGATWSVITPSGIGTAPAQASTMSWFAGRLIAVTPGQSSFWTSADLGATWTAHTVTGADWRGVDAGIASPPRRHGRHLGLVRGSRGVG